MYNLVACYDTLELKSRGDVLSDKVSSVLPSMQAMFEMEEKAPIYQRFHMPISSPTFCTHHTEYRQTSVTCLLSTDPPPAPPPGVPQFPGLARRRPRVPRPQDLPVRVHPHRHDTRPQVIQTTVLMASAF